MAMSVTLRCPRCARGVRPQPDGSRPDLCPHCDAPLAGTDADAASSDDFDGGRTRVLAPTLPRRAGLLPDFAPGEVLAGRFRVVRQLGSGGMGEVFHAEDTVVGGSVAIKVVRPDVVDSEEAAARLRREVKLARDVTHPNVCRTFDLYQHEMAASDGEAGEPLAIVGMELLDGEDLARRIRRGAMSVAEALPILRQIARGLFAAHRLGIVHRDLKPSNVLLVPESDGIRAVVTDFGIARRASGAGHEAEAALTQTGLTLGSPAYMAPEQLAGGKITPATDVYALGLVALEMVTGRTPFSGSTPWLAVSKRLSDEHPDVATAVPGLDPRYAAFITRCLARRSADRFADMTAVLHWLDFGSPGWDAYGHKGKGGARALLAWLRRPAVRSAGLAAAGLVALALAVGAWMLLGASSPAGGPAARPPGPEEAGGEPASGQAADVAADRPVPWLAADTIAAVETAFARRDGAAALTILEPLVAAEPEEPRLRILVAEAHGVLGRTQLAGREAERALALAGGLARETRLVIESRHLAFAADWSRARDVARSLWTIDPSRLDLGLAAAEALLRAGDLAAVETTVDALRTEHPAAGADPRVDLLAARVAEAQADFPRQIAEAHRAVDKARSDRAPLVLAEARLLEAAARRHLGELALAESAIDAARDIARQAGDELRRADAETERGLLALQRGRLDAAASSLDDALARYQALGHPAGELRARDALGSVRRAMGDFAASRVQLESAIEIGLASGLPVATNRARFQLAALSKERGRMVEAQALYDQVLASGRQLGDARVVALAQLELADLFLRLGRVRQALDNATGARDWFAARQEKQQQGIAAVRRAAALFAGGQPIEAGLEIDGVLAQDPEPPVRFLALVERCRLLLSRAGGSELESTLDALDEVAKNLREPDFLGQAAWLHARAAMQDGRDYDGVHQLTRALRGRDLTDPTLRAGLELTAAEAHILRQRPALAESALARAREQLDTTRDQILEWRAQLLTARLGAADSPRDAARRLADLGSEAMDAGMVSVAVEARLARALVLGDRSGLGNLAQTARQDGFIAVAEAAGEAQACVACF